jgi:VIT1/CCC1 family predicted Fe2+/Mn2+ transporter
MTLVSWVLGSISRVNLDVLHGHARESSLDVAKGLNPQLARQVAETLTELDPVAAHADAELRLEALGPTSGAVIAALIAGLCFSAGAAIPLPAMTWLPRGELVALTFVAILFALG